MRVMIVDDSAAMRMLVKRTLKEAGYRSMEFCDAEDGNSALERLEQFNPHLVLCDWNMPEKSGIELLRELRASGSAIKFGFVTTESTAQMRQVARESGAQFLVAKPFTAEAFARALRPVIGLP